MTTRLRQFLWLGVAIVVAGVLPIIAYWLLFENVPSVTPDEAKAMLARTNASTMLVDVRSPAAFAAGHLPGAVNWPLERIRDGGGGAGWEISPQVEKVLVLCDNGLMSARAVRLLRAGTDAAVSAKVFKVAGGLFAWNTVSGGKCIALNARQMSPALQWLAVITGFGIKPFYMLLTFIWVVWLWRRTEPDLVALRWGLIVFWLGENACSVNYLFFRGLSDLWEFLHNYGMAVGFSFVAWAVIEGVDDRLLRLSPPRERCALLSLCKSCIKHTAVPCKAQQVFKWLLPATMAVAALPLFAEIKAVSYNAAILGGVENYSLMASSQMFEIRYCSFLAIFLLGASWLVMLLKKDDPVPLAKALLAAALGPLGFGLMRLFLAGAFTENLLWYVTWEEWTELLFVIAVGVVLWLFRQALLVRPASEAPVAASTPGPS